MRQEPRPGLLGLPGPVPIVAWAPVVLFAVLFGLSVDYEVFLLSRVREQHESGLTGPTPRPRRS